MVVRAGGCTCAQMCTLRAGVSSHVYGPLHLHVMCMYAGPISVNTREQVTEKIRRDMERPRGQQRRNETETQKGMETE